MSTRFLSALLAACAMTASAPADGDAFACMESYVEGLKTMRGSFTYSNIGARRIVPLADLDAKVSEERRTATGWRADFLDDVATRARGGDSSAYADFDPEIAAVDAGSATAIYDTVHIHRIVVDGASFRRDEERHYLRPDAEDRIDTLSYAFDGSKYTTRIVSSHERSSPPVARSEEGTVGKDGLFKYDPRFNFIPPVSRSAGYGEFVLSQAESTEEVVVYTKTVVDESTGVPKAWARIEIQRGTCVPLKYEDGAYDAAGRIFAMRWQATYAPAEDGRAPRPIGISRGTADRLGTRESQHAIEVVEWEPLPSKDASVDPALFAIEPREGDLFKSGNVMSRM